MHLLVNELSKLTGTKIETIRSYRKQGLLHPVQNESNGYYYYTDQDIFKLFQIRRMRMTNMPIEAVRTSTIDNDNPVQVLQETLDDKLNQLEILQRDIDVLKRRIADVSACMTDTGVAQVTYFERDKYDIPMIPTLREDEKTYQAWMNNLVFAPISLHTNKRHIVQNGSDEKLPYTICLGTYEDFLEKFHFPLPEKYYVIPKGLYLTLIVKQKYNEPITYKQLSPLADYAAEHHYVFTTDTTAYLIQSLVENDITYNYYRIRIGIAKDAE